MKGKQKILMRSLLENSEGESVESLGAPKRLPLLALTASGEADQRTKHGFSRKGKKHKISNTYYSMKRRCYSPSHEKWMSYGGRGIHVCDRWLHGEDGMIGIVCFAYDMGLPPSPKHSLDRIDVDGNYEPTNCKWATQSEQLLNKRKSVRVEFRGRIQAISAWAKELGFSMCMLHARIVDYKWTIERAMTTPSLRKNPSLRN